MTALYPGRASRFELSAPVSFWWSHEKGIAHFGKGVTKNISHSGILVTANDCPPAGARIQINVRMPRLGSSSHVVELHGEGTVLRVEGDAADGSSNRAKEFAASVSFYPERVDISEQ